MGTVAEAIKRAERILPGVEAPEGELDPRWQAIIAVGEFTESEPDAIWSFVERWGKHPDTDLRMAIATCLLEHLLEHHFARIIPRVERAASSDRLFADTVSSCWYFHLKPKDSDRLTRLVKKTTRRWRALSGKHPRRLAFGRVLRHMRAIFESIEPAPRSSDGTLTVDTAVLRNKCDDVGRMIDAIVSTPVTRRNAEDLNRQLIKFWFEIQDLQAVCRDLEKPIDRLASMIENGRLRPASAKRRTLAATLRKSKARRPKKGKPSSQ